MNRIFEEIALKNNVTVDEVKTEMRKAIRISFSNSGKTKQWKEMFGEGRIPEPEEFIRVVALSIVA